jgi:peptidoglycan-associated lipoprotein
MFLRSKSKLLAFVFTSFLVQSACTKDEESIQAPVKADKSGENSDASGQGGVSGMYSPVFFEFDSSVVRDTYHDQLVKVSEALKSGDATVQIAGHCDKRGTPEYNMGLGERRAIAVKEALGEMGVKQDKVSTISYGYNKPIATGEDEESYSKNRRAEFHVNN